MKVLRKFYIYLFFLVFVKCASDSVVVWVHGGILFSLNLKKQVNGVCFFYYCSFSGQILTLVGRNLFLVCGNTVE